MQGERAYVVGSKRIPFTKSMTSYGRYTTQELMTASIVPLVQGFGLQGKSVGDVALGAVMNSSSNWNLAREVVIDSGLLRTTPAYNVQRACGTSLETLWHLSMKIANGQIADGIAAGVDTNSDAPIEVSRGMQRVLIDLSRARSLGERLSVLGRFRPGFLAPRTPAVVEPRTGLSMGQHTEKMVREWQIGREEQDELAAISHQRAVAAYERGFYRDLLVPFGGLERDAVLRADTTKEKLAKLKPAFKLPTDRDVAMCTLTAGNSSALTDGAAVVLVAGEASLNANGWAPLARVVDFHVSAVDFVEGAGLLMAPTVAVARMLERNRLALQDFDIYEIHEAFAGQVLCTLRAWESADYCRKVLGQAKAMGSIDRTKMNPVGSSLAYGHPFAATGARIVGTLAKELFELTAKRPGQKARGLISICTAGGMGVAAILESV